MSYNILRWKTKELTGLSIPLAAFYTHPRTDWHPEAQIDPLTNVTTLHCGCEQTIKGVVESGALIVSEIDMDGEGSGTFYRWILEPALLEGKGTLIATCIWEDGDVSRLTVKDGEAIEEPIDV